MVTHIPQFTLPVPQRSDPANFPARADLMMSEWPARIDAANTQADEVNDLADAAAASALTAINAPGTSATSTTSLTIGTGARNIGIQTGKALVTGMFVLVARTSAPGNWMHGVVESYDAGSGALVVNVSKFRGSGTYTDWTISLSRPIDFIAAGASDIFDGTSDDLAVTPKALLDAAKSQSVAFASTVTLDLAAGQRFHFATAVNSNFTLGNPSGMVDGRMVILRGVIGGSGNYAMSLGTKWKFPGGAPQLPTTVGSVFRVVGEVTPDGTLIEATMLKDYA